MNITQKRFIERWAQEILLSYSQRIDRPIELPVPIFDIAEKLLHLKCDVETFRGKLGRISAITILAKHWILLNRSQSDGRMRYSLAHEIVHWLIEEFAETDSSRENFSFEILRSPNARVRERVVEYFAGALLMPMALVMEYSKHCDEEDIQHLANIFGVSTTAMRIRIDQVREQPKEFSKLEEKLLSVCERHNVVSPLILQPHYTLINPPQLVFDHRFIRYIRRTKKKGRSLYFVLDQRHQKNLDLLIELKYGDGFVFFQDGDQQFSDPLTKLDEVEFIDLESQDAYYQRVQNVTQINKVRATAVAYTRDPEDEIPSKQLEIESVSAYIEPVNSLHTRTDAREFIRTCQAKGEKVVIVTGCFDLITNAHIRFLKRAKAAGDVLVVGIEDDQRIKAFKGALRPVNTASQRVEVLEAFQCVDFTFVIHGSPRQDVIRFYTRLHRFLRADILAVSEGDPYVDDRRDEIESAGGQLTVVSKLEDGSTTSILRRFLAETEFSDMVFVKKRTLYKWAKEESSTWEQLKLPFVDEEVNSLPEPQEN